MSGILCSCKVPWRIAVLDGKSVELCPVCGAWRESAWQVQPGLWQGDTQPPTRGRELVVSFVLPDGMLERLWEEYPKGDFEPRLPTEGGEAKLPREIPSFPSRAAAIRRLRLEAAGCLGVAGCLAVVVWAVWLAIS